jgi:hypothetical protein
MSTKKLFSSSSCRFSSHLSLFFKFFFLPLSLSLDVCRMRMKNCSSFFLLHLLSIFLWWVYLDYTLHLLLDDSTSSGSFLYFFLSYFRVTTNKSHKNSTRKLPPVQSYTLDAFQLNQQQHPYQCWRLRRF